MDAMARRDEGSLTYSADRGVWIGRYWVSLKTGKRSRKQVSHKDKRACLQPWLPGALNGNRHPEPLRAGEKGAGSADCGGMKKVPATLALLFGMAHNKHISRAETEKRMKVETYTLKTSTGRQIRKATQVVFPCGKIVRFTEKMTKKEALRQVVVQ